MLGRVQSSYCIRERIGSTASVAEQMPKEVLVSGLDVVTRENTPQATHGLENLKVHVTRDQSSKA